MPAIAFCGINASGKTSALKIISFVTNLLGCNPINQIDGREILGNSSKVVINSYFTLLEEGQYQNIYRLQTTIIPASTPAEVNRYVIFHEDLWMKPIKGLVKKELHNFNNYEPIMHRADYEDYLRKDVSFVLIKRNQLGDELHIVNLLPFTNLNFFSLPYNPPSELLRYLDPSIKQLSFERLGDRNLIHLSMNDGYQIILDNYGDLYKYLSSGTVKGINVFLNSLYILKQGGYMILDEIENHFNHELVFDLIKSFYSQRLNPNGATIVFSTHYVELLDRMKRNDCIYINRHNDGLTTKNLSEILKRNDMKRSEAYKKNQMNGTAPSYDTYDEWIGKMEEMIHSN